MMKLKENRLSQVSARLNLMVILVFGLLISNMILSSLAWYQTHHQTLIITPFSGNGYKNSLTNVNAHYLSLMSENFIYSRLNVTPETVNANYERLLDYVDSKNYATILQQLTKETYIIKQQKISSYFVITDIRIDNLTVIIQGRLHRHVGLRKLKTINSAYKLTYQYQLGRLTIISFTKWKIHHD